MLILFSFCTKNCLSRTRVLFRPSSQPVTPIYLQLGSRQRIRPPLDLRPLTIGSYSNPAGMRFRAGDQTLRPSASTLNWPFSHLPIDCLKHLDIRYLLVLVLVSVYLFFY